MEKVKIIRITTVASSLKILLKGQLSYMNQFYDIVGVSENKAMLQEVTEQEGIRTHEVPMTRKITPVADLKSLWQLYTFLKKEQPKIIHTHTPKAGTLGLLAGLLAGVPNRLHTIAGLPLMEATGAKRTLLNIVEKITYACATKVYPNSMGLETFALKEGFASAEKLYVIGQGSSNGINVEHFNPALFSDEANNTLKESLQIAKGERVLVFLGRLVADKGIHELIDAFVLVNKKFPNTTLLLGGDYERDLDPLRPETEQLMNTHPKIKALGHLKDVRPYLAIADVFVFPSYREGFPNVVMQAGAMGIPCIVSDINGCNEIIVEGKNGTIVPPKSAKDLEHAIVQFLASDSNSYTKSLCRSMIVDRYDQRLIWKLLRMEYEECLSNS